MHICIPDTREMRPPQGSSYLLYNVHIDGLYHCSLRYKQLLHLHQALTKKFSSTYHQVPPFPPKKLLPLSASQIEDRRHQLEKYLQTISQDKTISNSSIFNLFLLEAQRESTRIEEKHVHLDIELVNGQKIRLPMVTHDSADTVLTAVCHALGLNDRYHAYFCLCLCGYDVVRDKLIIKRRLSFFEAPFITLQMAIQQQEQLQSALSAASAAIRLRNNDNINIGNNLTPECNCSSCSQQQQSAIYNTTGVPFISSSNNINTNHRHTICNYTSEGGYHQTDSNDNRQVIASNSSSSSATSLTWSTTTRSFVTHRILLRKSYWDPIYDSYILNDQQALNLLFIQTVYDMKHSLMFVDYDTYQQLESLLASDSKLEYILLARTLKYYNYVHFEPCYSDYPRPRTKVMISIGCKELNMRVLKTPKPLPAPSSAAAEATTSSSTAATSSGPARDQSLLYCTSSLVPSGYQHSITKDDLVEEEYNFKVPLIRCWRLTSLETLDSGNYQQQQQQSRQISSATTTLAGGKRRSLSLFNSVVGSTLGLSGNSEASNQRLNRTTETTSETSSSRSRVGNLINSGTGGQSLMSTLASTSDNNINNSSSTTGTASGYSRINDSSSICNQQCGQAFQVDQTQLSQYELSFEYFVSKDKLKWITISSDQAIFISISLQGVVDELVSKRDCLVANNVEHSAAGGSDVQTPARARATSSAAVSSQPISILASRSGRTMSDQKLKLSESFTYLYRDGGQKLLKTQSIDRFCTTLGTSPPHQAAYSAARRGHRALATTGGSFIPQSAPANSRSSTIMQAGFWNQDSRLVASPSRHYIGGVQLNSGASQSTFEIANFKKAPSPIINAAFEGVTNDDD